jgi:hypothetical protein
LTGATGKTTCTLIYDSGLVFVALFRLFLLRCPSVS